MLFYDFVYVCLFAFGFLQHVFGHGVGKLLILPSGWCFLDRLRLIQHFLESFEMRESP